MALDRALVQYLERHAEPEAATCLRARGPYRACLVIPACDESAGFVEGLRPAMHVRALVIVVVNSRADASASVHAANAALLRSLPRTLGSADVLVVDRTSPGSQLPEGEGVGLARKIGLDIALAAYAAGLLQTPWLHTTDADVVLPRDYFGRVADKRDEVAAVHYPYWHIPCGRADVDLATAHYEVWLRYWVAGLRWARFAYGHPAVGSCMAVRAHSYAVVRGVPRRRQAGEDFHLLNKLRKQGLVVGAPGAPIQIRARDSARVPFGTGPGVRRRMQTLAMGETPALPDPIGFDAWRRLLQSVERAVREGHAHPSLDLGHLIPADVAARIVAKCNILEKVERARAGGAGITGQTRRVGEVLDGLLAVRFMHAVRDNGFPDGPAPEMVEAAPFLRPWQDPGPLLYSLRGELSLADGTQLA